MKLIARIDLLELDEAVALWLREIKKESVSKVTFTGMDDSGSIMTFNVETY